MDDTTPGPRPPAFQPSPTPLARERRPRRGIAAVGAALAVTGLLAVTACSGGSSDNNGSTGAAAGAFHPPAAFESRGDSAVASTSGRAPASAQTAPLSANSGSVKLSAVDFGRSQIKTAELGLRSKSITTVMTQIEGVATGESGFVASENTITDVRGRATSSSISIRVPVDNFEAAVNQVGKLGQVSSRRISTQDVTGRVADVASRVTSAKDSIAQLRLLFSHATKLSDIITLESELSDREADLESLLAQQRALTNATTLSTISVQVSRPPSPAKVAVRHDTSTGFLGGLKQGWNALADTFVAVSHGLGAALPLGLTILVIVGLLWAAVRRLPKRHAQARE
jgi:Domain of unknown function (DUF4349)